MLRIRYISHSRLNTLNTSSKIDLIMEHTKNNDIIIIDGRLKSREEAELIRRTMNDLHKNFEVFHGIEMATLYDTTSRKKGILNIFNKESQGITIIGPASIIEDMKHHPNHVDLEIAKNEPPHPKGRGI